MTIAIHVVLPRRAANSARLAAALGSAWSGAPQLGQDGGALPDVGGSMVV
ncbi:MAG: hypothetical protein WD063_00600 [Pirellulales bacterium]